MRLPSYRRTESNFVNATNDLEFITKQYGAFMNALEQIGNDYSDGFRDKRKVTKDHAALTFKLLTRAYEDHILNLGSQMFFNRTGLLKQGKGFCLIPLRHTFEINGRKRTATALYFTSVNIAVDRYVLSFIRQTLPLGLTKHAIQRMYDRNLANSIYTDISPAEIKMATLLATLAMTSSGDKDFDLPVPFGSGLLLCRASTYDIGLDNFYYNSHIMYGYNGKSEVNPSDLGVSKVSHMLAHTFISENEMDDGQFELAEDLRVIHDEISANVKLMDPDDLDYDNLRKHIGFAIKKYRESRLVRSR